MLLRKVRRLMMFFTGVHHPHQAARVTRAFISVNALRKRKGPFPETDWILDSGAFTTIAKHGKYPESVKVYADQIRRWKQNGNLLAAVSQDYMCEPWILARTGLTIEEHQRLTIERYDELVAEDTGVYIMPVLQGYAPENYVRHLEMYGDRIQPGMWVGVGSVCKRNANPAAILAVLSAIKQVRPDLRLHGFGLKLTALSDQDIRDLLYSADSMAWSYAARYAGRNANDYAEAIAFESKIINFVPPPKQYRMDFA